MSQRIRRLTLPAAVFVTGACVLIVEIVATRILAPYFGNTVYSVSSVISVVLAALSVGYWYGGRLADQYPSQKLFFGIIALSGVLVLVPQYLRVALLPSIGYALPLSFGPLIVSLILFFVPSFVLGMLSPFAVALQQKAMRHQGVGTTAGQIFFFSTVGSICGSLLAGFVLIPLLGISWILGGTGVVLMLLGIMPVILFYSEKKITLLTIFLATAIVIGASATPSSSARLLYAHDGVYEKIMIFDGTYNGHSTRFLQQDTSNSAGMYLDSTDLAYDYTKYYALQHMFAPDMHSALVLGGGAYSVPKALLVDSPQATVDVAEIEPSLPGLAQKYFDLPTSPRLTHHIEDGRRLLHDAVGRYDLIFSDVYHSMYSIPAHCTTKEFMQLVRSHLTDHGVFIANVIGTLDTHGPSFLWSEIKTMQQVFPHVYVFAVRSPQETLTQNIMVVGSNVQPTADLFAAQWRTSPYAVIAQIAEHVVDTSHIDWSTYPVLTDDYAPVDYLASKVLPER